MNNAPIGVLDSGMGGLTVWRELRRGLPHESLYYFGDGKNCPYGPKSKEEVTRYVDEAVQVLASRGIKMLVVACNAATAAAVDFLREKYDFPIVGMEPAVKPAAMSTKTGVIGILATMATLDGKLFKTTSARYAGKVKILSAVGNDFVELAEEDNEDSDEAVEAARKAIEPMIEQGVDRIVLGCTHYPLLEGAMRKVIGSREVELVDPAPAVMRRAAQLLNENNIAAASDHKPEYMFFTAADEEYLKRIKAKSQKI